MLLVFLIFPTASGYTITNGQLNATIYESYNAYTTTNGQLNASIEINSIGYFKPTNNAINATIGAIFLFGRIITITTTTIAPTGAGGGSAGRLLACPLNSHFSNGGSCVCDFGYALSTDGSCIQSGILPLIQKRLPIIPRVITIGLLMIILSYMVYLPFYKGKEKTKKAEEKIRVKIDKAKDEVTKFLPK